MFTDGFEKSAFQIARRMTMPKASGMGKPLMGARGGMKPASVPRSVNPVSNRDMGIPSAKPRMAFASLHRPRALQAQSSV
jgi:hypothetical protein